MNSRVPVSQVVYQQRRQSRLFWGAFLSLLAIGGAVLIVAWQFGPLY